MTSPWWKDHNIRKNTAHDVTVIHETSQSKGWLKLFGVVKLVLWAHISYSKISIIKHKVISESVLYHELKIRRCSISTHKSTYFFHKQHLFSYTTPFFIFTSKKMNYHVNIYLCKEYWCYLFRWFCYWILKLFRQCGFV
jgi:hypothetical protein